MDNETIKKRLKETTAPQSVIDAVTALIAENERLTIERNGYKAASMRLGKQLTEQEKLHEQLINSLGE